MVQWLNNSTIIWGSNLRAEEWVAQCMEATHLRLNQHKILQHSNIRYVGMNHYETHQMVSTRVTDSKGLKIGNFVAVCSICSDKEDKMHC